MTLINRLLCSSLLFAGMSVAPIAQAGTSTPEDLFHTFSACDGTFFEQLKAERETWSRYMHIGTYASVGYPVVPNRLREGQRIQMFDKPIDMGDVELVGYYDESSELDGIGKFSYWGFIANGTVEDTVGKIRPYIVDGERLVKDESGVWGRSERRYIGDPIDQWRKETIASNSAPKEGTVERVLIVEANESLTGNGRVAIECTVQGALTPALLERVRPDLDEQAMP